MIRMNNFKAEPAALREQELAAVKRVFDSGWFILGKEVETFEKSWADFCGRKFAVGVGNGMDAIEIGLRAMGIGPGDEVVTTPMTAIASVLAIVRAGATPVLADVDLASALLDPASVARCLTKKTKAVLLVHLYGQVREMEKWQKLDVALVEDCAQAHGARWNGKHAGSFGAFGAFSFYPTKNLGAKGDAGALVTDSDEIATSAKRIRNYGATDRYHHVDPGMNSRLDEMQAAILSARLPWLERFNARNRQIAARYVAEIKNPRIELLASPLAPENHVYYLFVVRCAERDRLMKFLKDREIESLIHFPVPAHQQECGRGIRCDPKGLTNAERHARECLSIPCHPQMSDDDVDLVVRALNQFSL